MAFTIRINTNLSIIAYNLKNCLITFSH